MLQLDGFLGATVRSVLAAATMAAHPSIPVKIFGSVTDGLSWLGRATPARLPPLSQAAERVTAMATALGVKLGA